MNEDEKNNLREWIKRSQAVQVGHLCNGFLFDEELSGSDGAHFTLFVPMEAEHEAIAAAKQELKKHYDVTGVTVVRVPADILQEFLHVPGGLPAGGWIQSMRWIVEHKQCRKIDADGNFIAEHKAGGQLCDLFTASRMVQVYDALNEKNREKFHNMSFAVTHNVAMKR